MGHPYRILIINKNPTTIMVCARRWKYDTEVREYFVETSTKQTIRNTELYKRQDVCDAGDALQQKENRSLVRTVSQNIKVSFGNLRRKNLRSQRQIKKHPWLLLMKLA